MRTITALLFVGCLTTSAFTQSTADLDKQNGFKAIKIGDKYSKYQNNLKLLRTDSKTSANYYEYKPSDEDLYNVFDTKMLQILLTFDKDNNLIAVMLHTPFNSGQQNYKSAVDALKSLNGKFTNLYGKATSLIDFNTYKAEKIGVMWNGLNVNLQNYVEYDKSDESSDLVVVFVKPSFAKQLIY
jgi:hypothetical protein